MALSLTQSLYAVGPNITSSFLGVGGPKPYSYAVISGGAGGTINSSTGVYTAPAQASSSPKQAYDTIRVTDASSATATAQILVGTPLFLLCDIIQREMNLPDGRVWVWDQKIFQKTDYDLYIGVANPANKVFGSNIVQQSQTVGNTTTLNQVQTINMLGMIDIDIRSRGPAARDMKEYVVMALNSTYSEQQQEANSFYIGRIPTKFLNLSQGDGAAIPYRYNISIQMQYCVQKITPIPFYDSFDGYEVVVDN